MVVLSLLTLLVAGLLILDLAVRLPPLEARKPSSVYTDTGSTRLGRSIEPLAAAHPGRSGILALPNGRDAFAARAVLAGLAERSLDIQYYIWRNDVTGTLLFEALVAAADRGVRVRLLLDDNNTAGLDVVLARLAAHPNIQVRLFNPLKIRVPRFLNYLVDFPRLNRRMHNKTFTADNQATIIGGRNVADSYFDAAEDGELVFSDLDVLAVGPVVHEVSSDFDRYWASDSAYPVEGLLAPVPRQRLAEIEAAAAALVQSPAAAAYVEALHRSRLVADLLGGGPAFEWAETRMVSDHPAKGLGEAAPGDLLLPKLRLTAGPIVRELDLVTPYLIPTRTGMDTFADMAARGVKIRILVNSLETTDLAVVHSGYAKYRKPLLQAGVGLLEMRLAEPRREDERTGLFGSGASSMHAKTFAADRRRLFIGSFNMDQRSAHLNTELGFIIESPALARRMADAFDRIVPARAYEVRLSDAGSLYWIERGNAGEERHETEPGTTAVERAAVSFMSMLPIDWLL